MNLSGIKSTIGSIKNPAKKIGTAAGAGVGVAYILKNRKDIFLKSAQEAAEKLGSNKKGIAIASGVALAFVTASTVIGRAVGAIIDKISEKISEKKSQKA